MNDKPTGTVTFLFTEIEDITKLAQEFPYTFQTTLRKHHSILTEVIKDNNGFVFKIIGDAFCCSFHNADNAVNAAAKIMTTLNSAEWEETEIKVRMGIHCGEAEWNGTDYMGYITLARTHRVMSSGYGGQILISENAIQNTNEASNNQISFRDMGERRLKDLIQPIKLYQLLLPDLTSDFPPLKTLDARPNNLPIQLTSFIGRENEMSEVKNLLSKTKLLTLLGPGGTGKTRISLQTGADMIDNFENGVWFVELASTQDSVIISQIITDALGLKEQPGQTLEKVLTDHLKNKSLLLILDNCEHVIDECARLSVKLLRNCPKLKIIATSRTALRADGELTHKVLPLAHPEPNDKVSVAELTQYEAVRLFIERALMVNSGFRVNNENAPALAQICYRLDGIPLAIELAAVRVKILTLENICKRLDDRFKLLTDGKRTSLPRQRTLRALIDWSYDLLSEKEKILWRRLSVFRSGWTLESAEEICSSDDLDADDVLDLINDLIENSIILYLEDKEKYKMLETVRQYGEERLKEAGETENFNTRHLKYFLNLCEGAIPEFSGPNAKLWFSRIEEYYPNIQTALNWSVNSNLKEEGNRLAVSMGKFWELRGYFAEGRSWFDKLLKDTANISPEIIANSKGIAGILAIQQGQYEVSNKYISEALELHRAHGNLNGIASSLSNLGLNAYDNGKYDEAKILLNKALEIRRGLDHRIGLCSTLNSIGLVDLVEGKFENAKNRFEESLEIALDIKDNMYTAVAYNNLGQIYGHLEDNQKTIEYFEKGLELDRELGNKNGISISLYNLGVCRLNEKNFDSAIKFFEEGLAISKEIGYLHLIVFSLTGMGQASLGKKDLKNAEKFLKEALLLQKDFIDLQCVVNCLIGVAEIIISNEKKYELAAILCSSARSRYELTGAFLEQKLVDQFDIILKTIIENIGKEKTDAAILKGKEIQIEEAIQLAVNS